jgi:chromosome segregation and condensation protein ScpB
MFQEIIEAAEGVEAASDRDDVKQLAQMVRDLADHVRKILSELERDLRQRGISLRVT